MLPMDFNYSAVGATQVASDRWARRPSGYMSFERTVLLGEGDRWAEVSEALMCWAVKTRSGFDVYPEDGSLIRVRDDAAFILAARFGPFTVHEPIKVVSVVEEADRVGFAYGTLAGHPVSGEEAFIVFRDENGRVWLTLRSLTRPAHGGWRWLFPLILVAQRWYRYRYLRALRG